MRDAGNERIAAAVVLLGAAAVFCLRTGARNYDNHDVPRYAQMALEMRHAGTLVPTLNGRPYHEAMPLTAWVPYAIARLTGELTPLTARVLPGLSALLTTAVVMALGWRYGSPRVGLLAAALTTLNHLSSAYAHQSRIDASLGLATAGTVALFFHAAETRGAPRRLISFALSGVVLGFGIAGKGPLAVVLAAATLGPALLYERRAGALFLGGAVALSIACAITAAWLAPYLRYLGPTEAKAFWDQFMLRENVERFEQGYDKARAPWAYLIEVIPNFGPWIALTALALLRVARGLGTARPLERLAASWTVFPFLIFSAATGKHARYLVPLVPGFAILAAAELDRWLEDGARALRVILAAGRPPRSIPLPSRAVVRALGALVVLSAAAEAGFLAYERELSAAGRVTTAAAAVFGVAAIRLERTRLERSLLALYLASASALACFYAAILPVPALERDASAYFRLAETIRADLDPARPLAAVAMRPSSGAAFEPSLLALYLGRWVEDARPPAKPPPSALVLTRAPLPGRRVIRTFDWSAHRSLEPERRFLLGPMEEGRPP